MLRCKRYQSPGDANILKFCSSRDGAAHTHLFFKKLALLWGQSVSFCNKWNDVDFVMKSLHELDVQRLQAEGQKMANVSLLQLC